MLQTKRLRRPNRRKFKKVTNFSDGLLRRNENADVRATPFTRILSPDVGNLPPPNPCPTIRIVHARIPAIHFRETVLDQTVEAHLPSGGGCLAGLLRRIPRLRLQC